MARKTTKRQPWTKEDICTLKTKTTAIARTLKRSVGATYHQALKLGITLGTRGQRSVCHRNGASVAALNGIDGMPSIIIFM
jgi:hypothetical protein